jgi:hypothetical protein
MHRRVPAEFVDHGLLQLLVCFHGEGPDWWMSTQDVIAPTQGLCATAQSTWPAGEKPDEHG